LRQARPLHRLKRGAGAGAVAAVSVADLVVAAALGGGEALASGGAPPITIVPLGAGGAAVIIVGSAPTIDSDYVTPFSGYAVS
jgi:hypothetical protein